MKICIIGAGIAGLSAAYNLSKIGHEVSIYESSPFAGGQASTIKIDDFEIEKAYHHLFVTDKAILKMMPFRNPINHMTVGFKKSQIIKLGGYPELFLKGDYGLWIKSKAANLKILNIDKSLVKAKTGKRMIKDRGGWKYILSEFFLQKFLLKNGLTNIFLAIFIFSIRSIIFTLPEYIRSLIYLKFLRSR